MRKRIFGVFFLLALLLPVPLTFYWLENQRDAIRSEMHEKMEAAVHSELLTEIRVAPEHAHTLVWKEKNEFLYRSTMYDVVRSEKEGRDMVYYCIADEKESQLEARLHSIRNAVFGKEIPSQPRDLHFVYVLELMDVPPVFSYTIPTSEDAQSVFMYVALLPEGFGLTFIPPPQRV